MTSVKLVERVACVAAKKLTSDIEYWYDYGIYLPNRHLYLGSVLYTDQGESGTDFAMAERAIKGLHVLDSLAPSGDTPFTVIMNNLGGNEYHMLAIYDAIQACRNHVTIIGTGHVMSAGAVIFQAADDRVLTENARMMIHYGTFGYYDHPKIAKAWADEGMKLNGLMLKILLARVREKHPDFPEEEMDKLLDFDTILNAEECVELGLADRIVK